MNDLFGLIGKLLPVGVIAGLVGIFYLLDVFSVRPEFDTAPAKPTIVSTPSPAKAPVSSSNADVPAPVAHTPVTAESPAATSTVNVTNPLPAPGSTISQSNTPPPMRVEQPPMPQPAPRYIPPGADPNQPLASDVNNGQAVELPSHEIREDEGERIEAETQQIIQQPEGGVAPPEAPPQPGVTDGSGDG